MLSVAFLCVAFLAGVILLKGTGKTDLKPAEICVETDEPGIDTLLIAKKEAHDMPKDWIGVVRGKHGADRQSGPGKTDKADQGSRGQPQAEMSDQAVGKAEAETVVDEPGDGIQNGGAEGTALIGEGGAGQQDADEDGAPATEQTNSDDIPDQLNGQVVDPGDLTEFDLSVDTLVFVKDPGAPDPMLRLTINRDHTQTLTADDEIVAVIDDTNMCVSDIVIVERGAVGIAG